MKHLFTYGVWSIVTFAALCIFLTAQEAKSTPAPFTIIRDAETSMPRSLFKGGRLQYDKETVPASVNVYLIQTRNDVILIDTGNGKEKGRMKDVLNELSVSPRTVTAILLTHVHPDHIGGLLDKEDQSVFPRATLYLSDPESVFSDSRKSPMNAAWRAVRAAYKGRIRTFRDGETLPGGVLARFAAGHTPGHTVFEYGNTLFIGDLIHGAALQMPNPDACATYDMDPVKAVQVRKQFLREAAEKNLTVAGAHLPFPGTGKVSVKDDGFEYKPDPVPAGKQEQKDAVQSPGT